MTSSEEEESVGDILNPYPHSWPILTAHMIALRLGPGMNPIIVVQCYDLEESLFYTTNAIDILEQINATIESIRDGVIDNAITSALQNSPEGWNEYLAANFLVLGISNQDARHGHLAVGIGNTFNVRKLAARIALMATLELAKLYSNAPPMMQNIVNVAAEAADRPYVPAQEFALLPPRAGGLPPFAADFCEPVLASAGLPQMRPVTRAMMPAYPSTMRPRPPARGQWIWWGDTSGPPPTGSWMAVQVGQCGPDLVNWHRGGPRRDRSRSRR